MIHFRILVAGLLLGAAGLLPFEVLAQDTTVSFSGLVYMDYAYTLDGPEGTAGDNGFDYRRLYFTTVYRISDDMRFQARLETNDGTTNPDGFPTPFAKDLFLRWDDALGEGHRIVIGVSAPPSYTVSERFFGFRSLEKTIMDKNKIVSSRDMGIAFSGDLTPGSSLKYAVMLANNNSVKAENDRHKRVYGQLEWYPSDHLTVSLGADYASIADGSSVTANGFVGYRFSGARLGVEGYLNPVRQEDALGDLDRTGISIFGAATLSNRLELVTRFDTYRSETDAESASGSFGLLGLSWSANKLVRFIPNVEIDKKPGVDALVLGRVTLHVDF